MAESNFANVMSIITSFNEVAECWGNVADLVAAITGDNGTSSIQSDMNQLCAEIESELQTLINAVNDQTALAQWAPCAATLNATQSSLNDYAYALASYSDGYVLVDSQLVSFESWCDGSDGDGTNGAIWTLAKQVGNLANLFLDGGEGNPSALDAWKNLCAAATAANASGFGGQTLFTLTFRLMQEVFAILSSLFYVRESALGLYFASNN